MWEFSVWYPWADGTRKIYRIHEKDTDRTQTGDSDRKAEIRCDIGDGIREYQCEILEIDSNARDTNKCFVLRITDDDLLSRTGGIVQGMSGSPVLQNGKLIGAITHVFVNDPTKGYGIFIENMME